jgi:phage shock protein C
VNPRRLYRSRYDRQLTGVAGGIAEYLEIDPTVVRILWILSAFLGGFTILLYIILAIVVPLEPSTMATGAPMPASGPLPASGGDPAPGADPASRADPAETQASADAPGGWRPAGGEGSAGWTSTGHDPSAAGRRDGRAGIVLGVLLVVFGSMALLGTMIPGWVGSLALGPAFVVALGVALVVGSTRRTAPDR